MGRMEAVTLKVPESCEKEGCFLGNKNSSLKFRERLFVSVHV